MAGGARHRFTARGGVGRQTRVRIIGTGGAAATTTGAATIGSIVLAGLLLGIAPVEAQKPPPAGASALPSAKPPPLPPAPGLAQPGKPPAPQAPAAPPPQQAQPGKPTAPPPPAQAQPTPPPAAPAPQQAQPGKPAAPQPPVQAQPAPPVAPQPPVQAQPVPPVGPQPPAQAQPTPPVAPQPPAQAQPVPPRAAPPPAQAQPTPPTTPAPPQQAMPAPAPVPADEPPAVTRLRAVLGPDTRLSYATAEGRGEDSARLTGVVMQEPRSRTTVEEAEFEGLRPDGVARLVMRGFAIEAGEPMAAALIEVHGLSVRQPAPGGRLAPTDLAFDAARIERLRAGNTARVAFDTLELANWGGGRPGRVALDGLQVAFQGGFADRVGLGRFALDGFDLAGLWQAAESRTPPPRATGTVSAALDALTVGHGDTALGGVASLRLAGDIGQDGTGAGTLAITGIRVGAVPGLAEWLRRFGYEAILGQITVRSRYDAASQRGELEELAIEAQDAGRIALSVSLEGLVPGTTGEELLRTRLVGFVLRYADASLIERVIRAQAQESGQPEAALRQHYAGMLAALSNAPALAAIREPLIRVILGQAREVEIAARPPEPIPLNSFHAGPPPGGPEAAVRVLGLSATAR